MLALLLSIASCSLQRSSLNKLEKTNTMEEAELLISGKPESQIIQLDSASFYSHPIYESLNPGVIKRIGNPSTGNADLYKLLKTPDNDSLYYVLHVQLIDN